MIDGIHFIAHNNHFNDIIDKIKFYQNYPDKLEKISRNGYQLAKEKFNENYVTSVFESNYNLI